VSRKRFLDSVEAEIFAEELVFGGDDPQVEAELVEVWDDDDSYHEAALTGAWGTLYVVWGHEDEVRTEIDKLGDNIDCKGRIGRVEA